MYFDLCTLWRLSFQCKVSMEVTACLPCSLLGRSPTLWMPQRTQLILGDPPEAREIRKGKGTPDDSWEKALLEAVCYLSVVRA